VLEAPVLDENTIESLSGDQSTVDTPSVPGTG
jgi:hypothetical protein